MKMSDQPEITTVSSVHQEISSVKISAETNMFLIHFCTSKRKHIFKMINFKKVPIFKPRFICDSKSDRAELDADNLNFSWTFSVIFFNFS
jgi:hypothetical protein